MVHTELSIYKLLASFPGYYLYHDLISVVYVYTGQGNVAHGQSVRHHLSRAHSWSSFDSFGEQSGKLPR